MRVGLLEKRYKGIPLLYSFSATQQKMNHKINQILSSALEKEDDLDAVVKLFDTHIGLLESMIDHELFHGISQWARLNCSAFDDDMSQGLLDLASLMPNRFNHCFHYLIIALETKDEEMLRGMGVWEKDIIPMLSWLKKNQPLQVEEAMSIKSQIDAHADSATEKESFKKLMDRLQGSTPDSDPVS